MRELRHPPAGSAEHAQPIVPTDAGPPHCVCTGQCVHRATAVHELHAQPQPPSAELYAAHTQHTWCAHPVFRNNSPLTLSGCVSATMRRCCSHHSRQRMLTPHMIPSPDLSQTLNNHAIKQSSSQTISRLRGGRRGGLRVLCQEPSRDCSRCPTHGPQKAPILRLQRPSSPPCTLHRTVTTPTPSQHMHCRHLTV